MFSRHSILTPVASKGQGIVLRRWGEGLISEACPHLSRGRALSPVYIPPIQPLTNSRELLSPGGVFGQFLESTLPSCFLRSPGVAVHVGALAPFADVISSHTQLVRCHPLNVCLAEEEKRSLISEKLCYLGRACLRKASY